MQHGHRINVFSCWRKCFAVAEDIYQLKFKSSLAWPVTDSALQNSFGSLTLAQNKKTSSLRVYSLNKADV